MKAPKLKKILEVKECHGKKWEDNYSWIHQKNILDVLKDSSKLDKKVRSLSCSRNSYLSPYISAGIQYAHRKLQRSVTDILRSLIGLFNWSFISFLPFNLQLPFA